MPWIRATAKRAIERGVIGAPLFVHTSFQTQGPDLWHPGPQFLFSRGAGPLLDMGPYYFTALVSLLGSVDRVAATSMKAQTEREIRTGPGAGTRFTVEVPTTLQVLTVFEGGQQATSLLSFDSALKRAWADSKGLSLIQVHLDPADHSTALERLTEKLSKHV